MYDETRTTFVQVVHRLLGLAHGKLTCTRHAKIANDLRPGDAVITFNYDVVAERALASVGNWQPTRKGYGFDLLRVRDLEGQITVLKLHGSLNFRLKKQGIEIRDKLWSARLYRPQAAAKLGIIPPTWSKDVTPGSAFSPIWRNAGQVLRNATEWVVVGYAMNPTDVLARNLIEQALVNSNRGLKSLTIVDPNQEIRRRWMDLLAKLHVRTHPTVSMEQSFEDYVGRLP
jgi:hypothetical protein